MVICASAWKAQVFKMCEIWKICNANNMQSASFTGAPFCRVSLHSKYEWKVSLVIFVHLLLYDSTDWVKVLFCDDWIRMVLCKSGYRNKTMETFLGTSLQLDRFDRFDRWAKSKHLSSSSSLAAASAAWWEVKSGNIHTLHSLYTQSAQYLQTPCSAAAVYCLCTPALQQLIHVLWDWCVGS